MAKKTQLLSTTWKRYHFVVYSANFLVGFQRGGRTEQLFMSWFVVDIASACGKQCVAQGLGNKGQRFIKPVAIYSHGTGEGVADKSRHRCSDAL